jgi:hypothetical protein
MKPASSKAMRDVAKAIRLTIDCSALGEGNLDALDALTGQLREELLESDVEAIAVARGMAPPPGARAVDPVALGTLVVTLAASRGVLVTLLQTIQAWIKRHDKDSITVAGKGGMKIRITGRMSVTTKHLVDAWISHQLKS